MTNMKFGIPSMIQLNSVEESLALCKELGLQFVELNTNFPQFQPQTLEAKELIRLSEQYGIHYTFHFDDNMNIADFNPYVAEGYRRTVLEVIDLAKEVGIPVLNMHMHKGAYYTMPEKRIFFFEAYKAEYLDNVKLFRDQCTEKIGNADIRICAENTDGFTDFQKEALELLLESPVFGLTLDIGHNGCAGYRDEPFYREHINRLNHMHIHDIREGTKDHLALGDGELDLPKYFALGESQHCTAVLETKTIPGLRRSAQWLKTEYLTKC